MHCGKTMWWNCYSVRFLNACSFICIEWDLANKLNHVSISQSKLRRFKNEEGNI